MRPLAAEALGTFALVFAGTGAIVINHVQKGSIGHVGVAMTFGLIVTAMIYTFGDVSGAHLNPAVTLGLAVARRCSWSSVIPYIAAQLAGAFLASGCLKLLFSSSKTLGETMPRDTEMQSLGLEAILTFILMLVILGATSGSRRKTAFAGIAIGATIGLEAMFAGPICGASMNPARSLAPAVVGGNGNTLSVWIYIVGPIAGAVLGALTHLLVFEAEPADISTEDAV